MGAREILPFTPEVFLALFEDYNHAIWPAQLVAYVLGIVVLALVLMPVTQSGRVVGVVLAALWLWNGVVYHGLHFATINVAAPVFAALFVAEALLVAWRLVVRNDITFAFAHDLAGWTGLALMVFALALYPLLGALAGHVWPQAPIFGVAPCPTVIFTFGVLLLARGRVPRILVIIPLLWALIGTSAVWLLDMPEDISLPAAGILALVLLILMPRRAT